MAENQGTAGPGRAHAREDRVPDRGLASELGTVEQHLLLRIKDFGDPRQESCRLFSELYGTFLLVIVAAGGGMMSQAFPGVISRTAADGGPADAGAGQRHPGNRLRSGRSGSAAAQGDLFTETAREEEPKRSA